MRRPFVFAAILALALGVVPGTSTPAPDCDWPMYGHDLGHSFAADPGCATISPLNVSTLLPRWFVDTKSPVTASPSVVAGTVYAGTYGGTFYAVDAASGKVRWTFEVTDTNRSDFGKIVSSAAVAEVHGTRVVVFGGASTLYVLDAADGALLTSECLDPRPDPAVQCKGSEDAIEIEASPAIVFMPGGEARIVAGMDLHDDRDVGRSGVVQLRIDRSGSEWDLVPLWKFDPETLETYTVDPLHAGGTGTGCGSVWSSPSVDLDEGLIFFGIGNCDVIPDPPTIARGEAVVAISLTDGTLVWRYAPRPADNDLDLDFGASAQLLPGGLMGEGGKDGKYYAFARRPGTASPQPVWTSHVASGSDIGGIIGSTSVGLVKGRPAIFAASAIPISTRDQRGSFQDILANPRHALALHAIDAETGAVLWDAPTPLPSYAATSYANGVVFHPSTFGFSVTAFHADLGLPLWAMPVVAAPSSAAAIVGSSIYVGSGTVGGGLPLENVGGIWSFGLAAG